MKKKQISILMATLSLLAAPVGLQAQDAYREARTGTVGIRLDGGASWSFGSSFGNVGANQINLIQPYGGAGVLVNIRPWLRLGADYSYTRMVREQLTPSLQPLTGDGLISGSAAGSVYRDFKTRFHGASFTGEFNLMEIGHPKGLGRFALWFGTGVGCLFSQGNTWTLNVSDEMRSDNWKKTVHFGGVNEPHSYNSVFIPATLTMEYAFLPQVSLTIGGGYRYLPGKADLAPQSQAYAKAGLVFNLTGRRYRSRVSGRAAAAQASAATAPRVVHDTTYVDRVVEKVVEVPAAPAAGTVTDDMLPYVTFERGSARLDEQVNASALSALVSVLEAHPEVKVDVFGWTDHTGGDAINETISADRAAALRDYLLGHGIEASRVGSARGLGKCPLTGEDAFSVMARRAKAVLRK